MRQKCRQTTMGIGTWIIIMLLAALFVFANPKQASAKTAQPFKTLKVGSYNLKKVVNREFFMYKGPWDGTLEYYTKTLFRNKSQTGKRFRIKLKKGYKMRAYLYYTNAKGQQKRKHLKNNSKLTKWTTRGDGNEFIQITVWKGKYAGYVLIVNGYDGRDEEDDDDY